MGWVEGEGLSVFRRTIMAHQSNRDHLIDRPTDDDLAGLYFLYPHKKRTYTWSNNNGPKYIHYNREKLDWIAKRLGITGSSGMTRVKLVKLIEDHNANEVVRDVGDQNGIEDRDDDGDGIPNSIEESLDAAEDRVLNPTSDEDQKKSYNL